MHAKTRKKLPKRRSLSLIIEISLKNNKYDNEQDKKRKKKEREKDEII